VAVVVSWNVAGRVRGVAEQAAALLAVHGDADVLALQEIRRSAQPAWRDALRAAGFDHQHYSAPPDGGTPERRLGVLIAARSALRPLAPIDGLPWPERHAAAHVCGFDLHALHAPISAKAERVKVITLERVAQALGGDGPPAVLVGDFNTPAYESRDGEVRSFARTRTGNLRDGYDERHDAAELGLIPGLTEDGAWRDAFRSAHGYAARDRSWMYANQKFGYRLDHILARRLRVATCAYTHTLREQRLSDHSAIWAELRSA
jgi:exonuclease III